MQVSEDDFKALAIRYLGESKETRAYGRALIRAAKQYHKNRAMDQGAADHKTQRERMKKLGKLLRQLERHTSNFGPQDWRNLGSGTYRASLDGAGAVIAHDRLQELQARTGELASGAEAADKLLAQPGRALDSGLWRFIYWSLNDYEFFFRRTPDLSDTSSFVALISEALPMVEPVWAERRDILSTIKAVARDLKD